MAKKLNQALLNEELKKFKLLSEYSFYTEKNHDDKKDDDLILGSGLEEADEPEAEAQDANAQPAETPEPEAQPSDDENLFGDDTTAEPADAEPADTESEETPAPGEDEVDIDVTQLVKSSDEATQAAAAANDKTSELLSKFDELEKRISKMDSLTNKIETLEKEIIKRNPTPVEKLEMRSKDSFPYNLKLSDYWKDVKGYDINDDKEEEEEYVLTKDDVDSGFQDISIKKSLDSPEEYSEEEVY
jgi:hypothetical protein